MRQYLACEIESRQGVLLKLVLEFTHSLYNKPSSQQMFGKIQVFANDRVYYSDVSKQSLNNDIEWDVKYLKIIQEAFGTGKDRHINLLDNKLSIVIQLNKGIRVTILSFNLILKQSISPLESLINSFVETSCYFQPSIEQQLLELEQNRENNSKIRSQLTRIKQTAKYEIDSIKQQFVKIINPLKLRMKKNAVHSNQNDTVKKQQATHIKAQNLMSVDQQIIKLWF